MNSMSTLIADKKRMTEIVQPANIPFSFLCQPDGAVGEKDWLHSPL